MKKIRVMIVDDSATVRQVLSGVLSKTPDIDVIATASDPIFAWDKMQKEWPDVLVLDVEMPRMDGITFLRRLMSERPLPVVICSTLTEKGTTTTMQALAAGAVGVAAKPTHGLREFLQGCSGELVSQIRAAAKARIGNMLPDAKSTFTSSSSSVNSVLLVRHRKITSKTVIAIGASTGGTQALEMLLKTLPATTPGILVVQHMPEKFTAAFANRLNSVCHMEVVEATTGEKVKDGRVLIAPGGKHLTLKRFQNEYRVDVSAGPPVNRHCPSVDVLYRSVASIAGADAIGIILTGMGDDGARGMKVLHDAGAITFAQSEASCVVYGMPKEAVAYGGVTQSCSLSEMNEWLRNLS